MLAHRAPTVARPRRSATPHTPRYRCRRPGRPASTPLAPSPRYPGASPRDTGTRVAASTTTPLTPGAGRVAFLGTGIMGTAMAGRLLAAGYDVTVWNRTPAAVEPLVAAGATCAKSPAAAAAAADVTIAMMADPSAAADVAVAAATGLGPGKGYVDASTVDAGTACAVAAIVAAAGGSYLEAPVSGSKQPALDGTLIFLCGGDALLYARVAPLLDVMGKARFLLGPVGAGANMKLVVNSLMGTMAASLAENLALAESAGLSPADVLQVVSLGAVAAPMFAVKGPSMTSRSYPTAFPLKHQQKDLRLALALADAVGVAAPLAAAANARFIEARAAGHGDDDFAAVYEAARKG